MFSKLNNSTLVEKNTLSAIFNRKHFPCAKVYPREIFHRVYPRKFLHAKVSTPKVFGANSINERIGCLTNQLVKLSNQSGLACLV